MNQAGSATTQRADQDLNGNAEPGARKRGHSLGFIMGLSPGTANSGKNSCGTPLSTGHPCLYHSKLRRGSERPAVHRTDLYVFPSESGTVFVREVNSNATRPAL